MATASNFLSYSLSKIEDEVVILARTRMNNQHICVGGYSIHHKRYVRLLDKNGQNLFETEPYLVGQVYRVEYQEKENIILPHKEDVCVHGFSFQRTMLRHDLKVFLDELSINHIHIKDLFDGLLNWEHGKGFLLKGDTLPNSSVLIVKLNHDLFLSRFEDRRFYFKDEFLGNTFTVKYIGVDELGNLRKIQLGRHLRFSLARWWDNNGNYSIPRAYLQLSGIF